MTDLGSRLSGSAVATRTPIVLAHAPSTAAGCWVGPGQSVYRCSTVIAVAQPSYQDIRPQRENLPPPGYVTVKGTSRVLVLRPPAKLACSRGDTHPKPGATLWAGVSWIDGNRRESGPAVPVTATSGGRTGERHRPQGRREPRGPGHDHARPRRDLEGLRPDVDADLPAAEGKADPLHHARPQALRRFPLHDQQAPELAFGPCSHPRRRRLPAGEARIPVTDEGLLRGDGVFEVVRLYGGRPFALDEHLERLARSAATCACRSTSTPCAPTSRRCSSAAGPPDARLRVSSRAAGAASRWSSRSSRCPSTLAPGHRHLRADALLDGVKSLSYAANMLATPPRARAGRRRGAARHAARPRARGADVVVLLLARRRLVTPPLDDHILASITRRRVLELVDVRRADRSPRDDLPHVSEAFLASTTREVQPVHAIDDARAAGAPGRAHAGRREPLRARIAQALASPPDA